jgi:NADH-quinone oxidoreductase subunit B
LEVERQKLRALAPLDQPRSPEELRVRQLRARQLLAGELEGRDLEAHVEERMLTTTMNKAIDWARSNAMWPATFGLACCAIEMMATGAAHYDLSRFGMEVFRASPRQADIMIVAGRVSQKMAPVLRQIYDQMPNPKWVLAMGVCASTGGMFNNYAIVQGVDHVVPVDMYLPGCPPRPEMLIDAMFKLRDKVRHTPIGLDAIEELAVVGDRQGIEGHGADEFDVGRFEHRVSRLQKGDKALRFDHSERIKTHLCSFGDLNPATLSFLRGKSTKKLSRCQSFFG